MSEFFFLIQRLLFSASHDGSLKKDVEYEKKGRLKLSKFDGNGNTVRLGYNELFETVNIFCQGIFEQLWENFLTVVNFKKNL
jgi:hypothetical protein